MALLASCSYEKRLEGKYIRAERKIEKLTLKYPKLLQKDTVRDTVSFVVPASKADTFFSILVDTVTVTNDRLTIRYERVGDTIRLSGECAADTIYKTVEIPVEKVVVRKQSFIEQLTKWIKVAWWLVVLVLLLLVAGRIAYKVIFPFGK